MTTGRHTTKEIGDGGETLATEALTAAGYAIVERNVRVGNVEVDIVAQNHDRLVFVEVKTSKADSMDWRYGIDRAKIRRLARAGATYVRSRELPYEVQIDAILVTSRPDGAGCDVEHLRDIALPPMCRR